MSKNSVQSKLNRDTFTYSSQTAKQTTATKSKTSSNITAKTTKTNTGTQTTSSSLKSEKTLSEALTGKNINGLNDYIKSVESKCGTKYVSDKFFGGDTTKYDPVKRASSIANVAASSLEQVQNAGGTGYKKIMNAYDTSYKLKKENISKTVSYNQNGGWFEKGQAACKATSLAIVASINSGTVVKPTDVGARKKDGFLSNPKGSINSIYGSNLNVNVINDDNTVKPEEQLNKIKESLSKGDAIAVQVTTNKGSNHWVVVTGTTNNCDIKDISSIKDLAGIDPWYGSCSQSSNGKIIVDKNVNATMNLGDKNKCLGNSKGYGYMTVSK